MHKVFAAIVVLAALAGCQQAELSADEAWVRLPAVQGRPGAAYFNVKGGGSATSLLAVSTAAAIRTELHEMKHEGGMMTMKPLKDVAIPAGQTVKFAPGGKHVMLFDIAPTVRAGTTVPLRLAFADGRTVEVTAAVKAAGDAN
ncbi:copper chaperone PCu(A)C [Sphingomonas sp. LT1P40]|uniref:copper chaperone PCu(A)C n=1 Tax=Alteristakelama amylovorans TaxID=3096166 RepID=UPI002FC625F8